jgi:hypothetical protein
METTGLLTFEDKMAMGKFNITTTTQGRSIFSPQYKGNKGKRISTIDKDIMVLAILEIATYPIGLLF